MSYCFKKNVTQQFIIFKTCSTLKLNFFIRFHTFKVIGPPGYLNRMVVPYSSADAEIQTNFVRHTGLPFQWDPCYELYKFGEEDTDLTPPTFVLWHPKSLQDFRLTKRFAATSLSELHEPASHSVSWYINYVGLVQPHHPARFWHCSRSFKSICWRSTSGCSMIVCYAGHAVQTDTAVSVACPF